MLFDASALRPLFEVILTGTWAKRNSPMVLAFGYFKIRSHKASRSFISESAPNSTPVELESNIILNGGNHGRLNVHKRSTPESK